MSFQRDNPKGPPNDLRRDLESPFLDEELFVDAEAGSTEERASRLIGYQLESPFQHAFEEGYKATVEPEVEAFLGELGEEGVDEGLEEALAESYADLDDELEAKEFLEELEAEEFDELEFDEVETETLSEHEDTAAEAEAPSVSEVVFPSGESLQVMTGLPEGKQQDYWDPTGSGNPLLDTGPAHKDKKLSTNFSVRELTTSGGVSADVARIDPKLVESLQRLRDHIGKAIKITSGFRSWKRNKEVYAKRKSKPTLSQHCAGRAVDIRIQGMNGLEIGMAAIDACGPNIGVGLANDYAHIDVRGFAAAWNYGGAPDSWVDDIKRYQKEKGGSARRPTAGDKPPAELVRFAQRVLNATEGERLADDGDLGRLTRGALERFRALYSLGPGSALDDTTTLALAQRALEALAQQSIFAKLGLFDERTRQALSDFRSEHGLGLDTKLDAATRVALTDALARR